MRVKLLPRIAEYRSKGWISAEEESDYHELLSSCPKEFGDTTDQVALQVKKSLDLAKVRNEQASSRTSEAGAATTSSRSLFRKPATGTGGQLTLQKKLSHRRKSRVKGLASSPKSQKKDVDEHQSDKTSRMHMIDTKELSIIEAMFGKDGQKEEDEVSTLSDKRKDRLAKARSRIENSKRFSPDSVNSKDLKDVVVEQQKDDHMNAKTSIEFPQRASPKVVSKGASILSKAVAREHHEKAADSGTGGTTGGKQQVVGSTASEKTNIQLPVRVSQKGATLKRVASLSNVVVTERDENVDTDAGTQQVLGPEPSLFESLLNRQQENVDRENKKLFHQRVARSSQPQHGVLKEAPAMSQAKLESANNSRGKQQICEPRELCQKTGMQSEEEVKDLFVEMAFFARLGFVQPPSCLQCVYRESIDKSSPDRRCERFVPWRKDANVPIHPHQLKDNIMLVQCQAARSLVEGKQVETYHWDKMKRKLIGQ